MNNTPAETKTDSTTSLSATARFFQYGIPWIFWGILSVLFAVYCGRAIYDPDFWWHLKSGEVMLDQGGLLNTDPFNYTGDVAVHRRESIILKGYWLWQVTAALFYRMWDFYGIIAFKCVTMLLLVGGILREMRRQSVSPFLQMLLTGLGSVILIAVFHLERPQIYSFIFLTLLLGMVAQVRLGRQPSWMLLPLMVVWSNIHGGFVVGDILLVLFAAGAIVQYRNDRSRLKLLLFWAIAGIAASLVNPTGWNSVLEVLSFSRQHATQHVQEYKSSWAQFNDQKLIVLLWLIAGLHVAGLFFAGRKFWPEIFISIFLIVIGLKYMRNEGFIAVSLLPMTGWYLDRAGAGARYARTRLWQTGALLIVSALLVWMTTQEWEKKRNGWPVNNLYPEKMALFLWDSGLSGHLFNEYETGGYLDWALYPKWQTFIDGRGLDYRVFDHFKEIFLAGKKYDVLLEEYDVDVIALGTRTTDGRTQPLLKLLLNNPRWIPVYLDWNSFVLARNSVKNSTAINKFKIDKKLFLDTLLAISSKAVNDYPEDFQFIVCYTELLIYAGKYSEAEVLMKKIERMKPGAEVIPMFKRHIDALKVKR